MCPLVKVSLTSSWSQLMRNVPRTRTRLLLNVNVNSMNFLECFVTERSVFPHLLYCSRKRSTGPTATFSENRPESTPVLMWPATGTAQWPASRCAVSPWTTSAPTRPPRRQRQTSTQHRQLAFAAATASISTVIPAAEPPRRCVGSAIVVWIIGVELIS